jgi:hypothetical protein
MRKFVMLPLAALILAGALSAAPVACPTDTTLAALIALSGPTGGCFIQDKIFNNFAYTGTTAAASVDTTLVFTPGPGTTDIHGWVFAPVGGPWTAAFTLSYTIMVAPSAGAPVIVATKDQINTGLLPNSVVVTDLQTPDVGSPVTLITRGIAGQETMQVPLSSAGMVRTSTTATIPSGNLIQSYEQDWFQAGVPEPASLYSLAGGACVLFGLLRFKKKARV